jgi:hypothetical protein
MFTFISNGEFYVLIFAKVGTWASTFLPTKVLLPPRLTSPSFSLFPLFRFFFVVITRTHTYISFLLTQVYRASCRAEAAAVSGPGYAAEEQRQTQDHRVEAHR